MRFSLQINEPQHQTTTLRRAVTRHFFEWDSKAKKRVPRFNIRKWQASFLINLIKKWQMMWNSTHHSLERHFMINWVLVSEFRSIPAGHKKTFPIRRCASSEGPEMNREFRSYLVCAFQFSATDPQFNPWLISVGWTVLGSLLLQVHFLVPDCFRPVGHRINTSL